MPILPDVGVRWSVAALSAADPDDVRVIVAHAAGAPRARLDAADAAMALLVELLPVDDIPVFTSVTIGSEHTVTAVGGLGDDLADYQRHIDAWLGLVRPARNRRPGER